MKSRRNRARFQNFLAALDRSGIQTGTHEVACHHSAVEVNEWKAVQEQLRSVAPQKVPKT